MRDSGGDSHLISTTTIRAEIEDHIKQRGTTLHQFAELAEVNVGTLSGIISGNRPISVGQLDRITTVMGFPEGHFYDLYVNECLIPPGAHWRRLRPFLLRCAELERYDCLKQVLNCLLEDLKQIGGIYDTAEMMFSEGWKQAATLLYESVIECERSNHSERLAMSYFRLYQIFQNDVIKGFKAAMQFLPYRYRVPEAISLEGLLMLTETYAIRLDWVEVENYACELRTLARVMYDKKIWKDPEFTPEKPLVYYYGMASLFMSGSYDYQGRLEESRKWIAEYADLSWFEGLDEAGRAEVALLKTFAKANFICVDIKSGNRSRISEYVEFLEQHPDEIVEGLITLIESANRHHFFVDDVITKFSGEIEKYRLSGKERWQSKRIGTDNNTKAPPYYFRYSVFFQDYALYNFRKGLFREGIKDILYSMKVSLKLSSKDLLTNSMAIFELYRQYASEAQCKEYSKLCREVWENEKENILGGFGFAYV